MGIKLFSGNELPVASGNEYMYNIIPVGSFIDARYGKVDMTPEFLGTMAKNFGHYPDYKLPVKLGHDDGAQSVGLVNDVIIKEDGLYIKFAVDDETSELLRAKRYRYMSAECEDNYMDKSTGEKVGPVLVGVALVNQPANPNVQELKFSEGGNVIMEDQAKEVLNARITELEGLIADLRAQVDALKSENEKLTEEKEEIEEAVNEAEVKEFSERWASKGIPPVVLEKIKPLLQSKTGRVLKFSDKAKDSTKAVKFFDEIFSGLNSGMLRQYSDIDTSGYNARAELERGKRIAESLKR